MNFVDPTGLEFFYNQRTGQLSFKPNPDSCEMNCPEEINIDTGYSDAPGYINDSNSEHLSSRGPIPRGVYMIGLRKIGLLPTSILICHLHPCRVIICLGDLVF